jgi:hypothetical protein
MTKNKLRARTSPIPAIGKSRWAQPTTTNFPIVFNENPFKCNHSGNKTNFLVIVFKIVLLVSLPLHLILLLDQKYQIEAKEGPEDDNQNKNLTSRGDSQVGSTHCYLNKFCFK